MLHPNHITISVFLHMSNGWYTHKEGDHLWVSKSGDKLVTNSNLGYALFITDRLINDTSDLEELKRALDEGALDFELVKRYKGLNILENFKKGVMQRLEHQTKIKAVNLKIAELDKNYPQLSEQIKQRVKRHDRYYDFSDDMGVYRAGKQEEACILNELAKTGAEGYFKSFLDIHFNKA